MFKMPFHNIFSAAVGKTPYEYLTRLRLEEAKRLILMGELSMSEIAEQCGFSSTSYFIQVFHKTAGVSPDKYRRTLPNEEI